MSSETISEQKAALRQEMRARLNNMTPQFRTGYSHHICSQLTQLGGMISRLRVRTIAVYLARPDEVNVDEFARCLLGEETDLFRPRSSERHFQNRIKAKGGLKLVAPRGPADAVAPLYPIQHLEHFEIGPFGTREPKLVAGVEPVTPEEVGLWILPGLAFDEHRGRLGRGGGWYDRVLSRAAPNAPKVGVCFERQRVLRLPQDAHDARVDRVLTEIATIIWPSSVWSAE